MKFQAAHKYTDSEPQIPSHALTTDGQARTMAWLEVDQRQLSAAWEPHCRLCGNHAALQDTTVTELSVN